MDIRINTPSLHPYHDKVFGSEELKKNYNLQEVIDKIKTLAASEHTLCLFIGRQPSEPLPKETHAVWISGDKVVNTEIPDDRLHLWLDFIDSDQLKQLTHLFDKIIIDNSTVKFLGPNAENEDF